MKSLPHMTQRVREYLALRRAFGFQLIIAGQQLQRFARFADRVAPGKPLTVEIALRWAQRSPTDKPTSAARRLLLLRPFARYLRTVEPLTQIPPNACSVARNIALRHTSTPPRTSARCSALPRASARAAGCALDRSAPISACCCAPACVLPNPCASRERTSI